MKYVIIPLTWLMIPVATLVVAYDIAKAAVEAKAYQVLKGINQ